ncbi:putative GLTSCR protein region [Helianthus annuus]|nr:putative GLTSCR protein region [Helianthus annuus]KAJ0719362.1 putative GLTSCR protein region [Helianthus annuus]
MAYEDAWRVCHPDFKRPFSSLEDACERYNFPSPFMDTFSQFHKFHQHFCYGRHVWLSFSNQLIGLNLSKSQ